MAIPRNFRRDSGMVLEAIDSSTKAVSLKQIQRTTGLSGRRTAASLSQLKSYITTFRRPSEQSEGRVDRYVTTSRGKDLLRELGRGSAGSSQRAVNKPF